MEYGQKLSWVMRKNLVKGVDTVNVCDFGGAVRELSKKNWRFRLKGVSVADSDWDEDDWESVWIETFDLGMEDRGGDQINDDCDKYDDDDDDCEACGDNTSCDVSIINFENLMFPFSIGNKTTIGIKPAQRELIVALEPTFTLTDNMDLATSTMSEHITTIHEVMKAIHVAVRKLNPEKFKFGYKDISFWVMIFSADEMQPDPAK